MKLALYNPEAEKRAGKNRLARNALIFGIFALVFDPIGIVGILAMIYGILALRRIRRWRLEGVNATGQKKAIWGLVLGAIGIALTVAVKGFLF